MQLITIEASGVKLVFRVVVEDDDHHAAPWKHSDCHGPVSDWTRRAKQPGEILLNESHGDKRYYDFAEATLIAKRDGWGISVEELEQWTQERGGCRPSKAMIARRAVEKDFEYLRGWCNDEWRYVGVTVTLLDEEGDETEVSQSLWGVDTYTEGYTEEVAQDLANELAAGMGKSWHITTKTTAKYLEAQP